MEQEEKEVSENGKIPEEEDKVEVVVENGDDTEETNKVLEAGQVFVLMNKQFRLSRNARAQW